MPTRNPGPKLWRGSAFAILLLLSACSYDAGTLTALATHNVNVATQPLGREVEGSDCAFFVLGIPVAGTLPNLKDAMDNALAREPQGDALENIAVYIDRYPFERCLRVKGDVVQIGARSSGTSLSEEGLR